MSPHRWKAMPMGALALGAACLSLLQPLAAQTAAPTNNLPNPYREVDDHFQLPEGRKWGQVPTADIDSKGHIWVLDRCGETRCTDSMLDPVLEFDASGKLLKSFGRGMFVFPHGIFIDKDRQYLDDGRRGQKRQRSAGDQVRPGREGSDAVRQGGRGGHGSRYVQ